MLGESGDEEESDNIITQVLDEIGIEVSGKVKITGKYVILIINVMNSDRCEKHPLWVAKLVRVPNLATKKLKHNLQS